MSINVFYLWQKSYELLKEGLGDRNLRVFIAKIVGLYFLISLTLTIVAEYTKNTSSTFDLNFSPQVFRFLFFFSSLSLLKYFLLVTLYYKLLLQYNAHYSEKLPMSIFEPLDKKSFLKKALVISVGIGFLSLEGAIFGNMHVFSFFATQALCLIFYERKSALTALKRSLMFKYTNQRLGSFAVPWIFIMSSMALSSLVLFSQILESYLLNLDLLFLLPREIFSFKWGFLGINNHQLLTTLINSFIAIGSLVVLATFNMCVYWNVKNDYVYERI